MAGSGLQVSAFLDMEHSDCKDIPLGTMWIFQ